MPSRTPSVTPTPTPSLTKTPTPSPSPAPSYTLVDASTPCAASGGCPTAGTSNIYFDATDYAAFLANGNVFGGIGGGAPTTCTAIARSSTGTPLSTRYHYESTGTCWKITGGNFSYNPTQC